MPELRIMKHSELASWCKGGGLTCCPGMPAGALPMGPMRFGPMPAAAACISCCISVT